MPVVADPVVIGGFLSVLTDTLGNTGNIVRDVVEVTGGKPRTIPSVVVVAPGEGKLNVSVFVPLSTTIPLGPKITVSLFDNVTVDSLVPMVKVSPSRTMTVEDVDGADVPEPPGSRVNVKPSLVNVMGDDTCEIGMVSDPITTPLGPRTMVCPLGAVMVSRVDGTSTVVPPTAISPRELLCDRGDETWSEFDGVKVSVTPSVVNVTGPVAEGN